MTELNGVKRTERIQMVSSDYTGPRASTATAVQERQSTSPGGNPPPDAASTQGSKMVLIEAANTISNLVQNIARELSFSIDDSTGRSVITVMDQRTEQVIRQIPGEEFLQIARHLQEATHRTQKGILINSEA